jgi:16S rRNA (uracil1498-N3)-methyltransferase
MAHRLLHVLRVKPGARLVLFDGAGREAQAEVLRCRRDAVDLMVETPGEVGCEPALRVTLAFALSKGDKPEWIVQKAVELGAAAIVIFAAERSVARWAPDQVEKKLERLSGVIDGACAQSRRAVAPSLRYAASLLEATTLAEGNDLRLALDPDADVSLAQRLAGRAAVSVALVSGPEGGLTPGENALLQRAGFVGASLGPLVLRAETATLAALAIAQAAAALPAS